MTKSDNPIEPNRSGPAEPDYREDGAPETVMGDLAQSEYKVEARPRSDSDGPQHAELGFGSVGGAVTQAQLNENREDSDTTTYVRAGGHMPLA